MVMVRLPFSSTVTPPLLLAGVLSPDGVSVLPGVFAVLLQPAKADTSIIMPMSSAKILFIGVPPCFYI